MSNFDSQIKELKQFAKAICDKNDVSFCGIFHNSNKSFEKTIIVGNTISSLSELNFNNSILSNLSLPNEMQPNFSYLLKPIETTPPSISIATGTLSSSSTSSSKNVIKEYKMINIDPNNTLEVKNYLYNCFEEFQQIPCKLLSKSWIKLIEPRKQSKYPYKQGDLTKPYWWPSNARHKEPDHLKKDERINLLISILRVFKHREPELIHSASTINELSPSNKLTNTGDEFGSRKLEILGDMFKVVKCQLEFDRNTIRVIKPGKKYSSQIYQKQNQKKPYNNNVNFDSSSFSHSSLLSNGSVCNEVNNSSNNEEEIRIAQILATPTNNQSNHFNDLSQYFSNKSTLTSNLQNDYPSALKQSATGEYNSLLSSPFTPNQATTIMMTKNTSLSEIDENSNHNNRSSNRRIPSNSNNNIANHNIDPKFLIPPQISTNRQSLNSSPLSSILYNRSNVKDNRGSLSSSPSSIFNKAINQHSGILSSLSPSHLNVMKIPPSQRVEGNKNHRVVAKGNNSNGFEIGSEDTIILPHSQL